MRTHHVLLICGSIVVAGALIAFVPRLLPPEVPPATQNPGGPPPTGSERPAPPPKQPDPPGTEPGAPPNPAPQKPKQETTLRVKVSRAKIYPADWRLYLDGKLVAGKTEAVDYRIQPLVDGYEVHIHSGRAFQYRDGKTTFEIGLDRVVEPFEFPVPPGTHKVELLSRQVVFSAGRTVPAFPYHLDTSGEITISKGASGPVQEVVLTASDPVSTSGRFASDHPALTLTGSNLVGIDVGIVYPGQIEKVVTRCVALVEEDPILRALFAAERQFQAGTQPGRPTLLLQLPREAGGARECDGAQVRTLVDWLVQKYWGWVPQNGFKVHPDLAPLDPRTGGPNAAVLASFQQEIDKLNARVNASRGDVRRLSVVADWLDRARK